jgi:glycosyltransferase involved in cell wall biosynthesis
MPEVAPAAHPTFSVVIPCRNEAANAEAIATAVIAQLEPTGEPFELIFIDNASTDDTVAIIRRMSARDPRIALIVNTRNFGQMRSPTHAIYQARGRAVIAMCADFQDPPELIERFVARWRAGVDIVLGVRESERSARGLGIARGLSYELGRRFADYPLIPNATGFGLYDARVVRALAALDEPEPFFRGLLVETGYTIETITYPRPQRRGGRSNNNLFTLIDFALSGLTSSSKKLLRVPLYLGVLAIAAALLCLLAAAVSAALGGPVLGWVIAGVAEAQFGLLLVFLGLLNDQVRLIAERTRRTPLVIERERINLPERA